jgi:hypothetical protein
MVNLFKGTGAVGGLAVVSALALSGGGCVNPSAAPPSAKVDAAVPLSEDAGSLDSGAHDSGAPDSGAPDSGPACVIGGTTYTGGAANPTNACQSCELGTSATSWSNVANGTTCGTNQVCNDGACAECVTGTTECTSATQAATCLSNGTWGPATTCSFVCAGAIGVVGGNCGGACVPGTTECATEAQVATCGTNGEWGPATACADDAGATVCVGNQCENIAGSLEGLEWYVPCTSGGSSCSASNPPNVNASLSGATGVTYAVTFNFEGVVEERTYIANPPEDAGPDDAGPDAGDAGAAPVATGTNASFFITNVETPSLGDPYNIYSLTISDPPLVAYLNAGTSSIGNCWLMDYTVTLPMAAGAQVTLAANTVDGEEIANHDVNGNPIVAPGLFDGGAFNGQFIVMNVVSVAPLP